MKLVKSDSVSSLSNLVKKMKKPVVLFKNNSNSMLTLETTALEPEMDCIDKTYQETTEGSDFGVFGPLEIDPSVRFDKDTEISEQEVRELFYLWNDALATLDPDQVALRYSSKPCLLPIVSDVPRTDYRAIRDYFVHFLEKRPKGVILESHVTTGPGWCMDNGIYEFYMEATGDFVKARYSFVYTIENGKWKISHHHSSQMPEGGRVSGPVEIDPSVRYEKDTEISEQEVRNLFHKWNDALGTLDPDQVAMRYSSKACLLPTVSDVPRTDYLAIKDYFVHFLEKKPKGMILESHVTSGPGWCMDNGIYLFYMGTTGETVKARYSFVYTIENGKWKISHHHSSQMPEQVVAKKQVVQQEEKQEKDNKEASLCDTALLLQLGVGAALLAVDKLL